MTHKNKPSAEATAKQVVADLREAQEALKFVDNRPTRERLELLLSRAELRVRDLQELLTGEEEPDRPEAASTEEFARVLTMIKAKWPDRERLALITDMGRFGHYTSVQVRALLEAFDFDDNKVEAAIMLYPKLTDPESFFQSLEAIDASFKREEVRTKLNLK
jgi:hypothetical protein